MEGINKIRTGTLVPLSEQQLVDCDKTDWGCDGGIMGTAFQYIADNGGLETQAEYGFTSGDGSVTNKCLASPPVSLVC